MRREIKFNVTSENAFDGSGLNPLLLDEAGQYKKPISTPKTIEEYKQEIINASYVAVDELIKVLRMPIIAELDKENDPNGEQEPYYKADITSEKMKNAAAAKKLACFDAFEIITRISAEQISLDEPDNKDKGHGLAESRAK